MPLLSLSFANNRETPGRCNMICFKRKKKKERRKKKKKNKTHTLDTYEIQVLALVLWFLNFNDGSISVYLQRSVLEKQSSAVSTGNPFCSFHQKELLFSLKIASTEQQTSGNDFVKEFQNTTKSIWTDELQQCWSDFCRSNYIILNSLNNYSITSMSRRPQEAQLKTFWGWEKELSLTCCIIMGERQIRQFGLFLICKITHIEIHINHLCNALRSLLQMDM